MNDDALLECLNTNGNKVYRIEEIPKDEAKLEPGEFLVPVAHFSKEIYQTFGTPFLLKLKNVSCISQSVSFDCLFSTFLFSFLLMFSLQPLRRNLFHKLRNEFKRNSICLTKSLKSINLPSSRPVALNIWLTILTTLLIEMISCLTVIVSARLLNHVHSLFFYWINANLLSLPRFQLKCKVLQNPGSASTM